MGDRILSLEQPNSSIITVDYYSNSDLYSIVQRSTRKLNKGATFCPAMDTKDAKKLAETILEHITSRGQ